ncbi:MAG TPA: hypothetical protein VMZ73_08135 [Acidimicrobiales bacterium]|nr:hypothetical protein [Acidimicrobiales bacterium]
MEELDGVEHSQTDSRRGRTVVRGDPAVASVESIVAATATATAVWATSGLIRD